MAYLLTKTSVISCPHGGSVTHSPKSFSGKLINGAAPMLLNDAYAVVGCPFPSPCKKVLWTGASKTRSINGTPVLTNASVGVCTSAAEVPQGQAIISLYQTKESD